MSTLKQSADENLPDLVLEVDLNNNMLNTQYAPGLCCQEPQENTSFQIEIKCLAQIRKKDHIISDSDEDEIESLTSVAEVKVITT